ncbi:S8 family peptidase [Pseudomonas fluorescens]|uniref:S8 family peptidase n=1 Tax=Pseudomonas fluorescens TaxID=294 RepID=UPI0002D6F1B3|nr:S8 family serine peptidase [Pseudomonas fluorescens]
MNFFIPAPAIPRTVKPSLFTPFDIGIDALLGVPLARKSFQVDGSGLAVAVLDTGLRVTHECFAGRVVEGRNFTGDDDSDPSKVTDYNGHGTNVTGLIAAGTNDERRGIAPMVSIIPLKVFPAMTIDPLLDAFKWIDDNAERLSISVVNLSLGVPGINLESDEAARIQFPELHKLLKSLHAKRIAVVFAAGNSFKEFESEGMSIPAIFREAISVGAVYDSSVGERSYEGGAVAFTTHADQITPYTQRLSKETSPECYTDVFSAGGAATSAGAEDDHATSIQDGTSQAAPTVAGIILLLQQHYQRLVGELPPVTLLQEVLRSTSTWIVDGDDEADNVKHTQRKYPRVNAFESLVALDRYVKLGAA